MDSDAWILQFWPISKNLYLSTLCWHWVPPKGPIKCAGRRMRGKSQRNPCSRSALMIMMIQYNSSCPLLRCVKKVTQKLYLPKQKGTINEALIFFQVVLLGVQYTYFNKLPLVEAPMKLLFCNDAKLHCRISFVLKSKDGFRVLKTRKKPHCT